jgi:hypothetical protein
VTGRCLFGVGDRSHESEAIPRALCPLILKSLGDFSTRSASLNLGWVPQSSCQEYMRRGSSTTHQHYWSVSRSSIQPALILTGKLVQSGSGYVCRVLHGRTAPTLLVQESPGQILPNAYPTLDLTDPGIAPSPDLLHASAASSASAILPLPRDGDRRG